MFSLLFVASLLIISPLALTKAQSTTTISVSPQNSTPAVGQTLTITIQLSNVQNLYGVDIVLDWNPSMLTLQSNQSYVGVETYSNGILHNPTVVVQDTASQEAGEYHLVATSENPAAAFSGSGTIATLTFTVAQAGTSSLTLNPELASYVTPGSGDTSQFITANVVSGTVTATSASSSASPTPISSTSPTPTATETSTATSSLAPTATVSPTPTPEFPIIAILAIMIAAVSSAVLLIKKNTQTKP